MSNKKGSKSNKNDKTKKIKTVNDDAKTKRIDTVDENTNKNKIKKEKKPGKTKKKGKHRKLKLFLKIVLVLFVLVAIVVGGVIAGVIFGLFGDELKITKETFAIETQNTVLLDKNGNQIATLNGEENREVITLNEMGKYLPEAFISIEDERFKSHSGVDILRTLKATLNYMMKGDSSYGGSTITQQLVKNATGDNDKSPIRKIKEIVRAYQTESIYSKDQILEAYLNTSPLGGGGKNVYGVEIATRYYFDKKPIDLTIAEAAYIAGITHSPNIYNPFKENPNTEKIAKRTKTVLAKMKELGKIDEAQHTEAVQIVEQGLPFKEGVITSNNDLTQHEEAALKQVVNDYAQKTNLEYKVALTKIKGGGYKIYTTEDKAIQTRLEEEYKKEKYIGKGNKKKEDGSLLNEQTQSSMTIIENSTGYVVGCIGVLGEKTAYGINRATDDPHQPGSSIKPIATIAPSLEEGVITAASVIDDSPKSWGGYTPHNAYAGYKGLLNIRKMIELSSNVPEVKLMQKLTPAKSVQYLKNFGLGHIDTKKDEALSTALGGLTTGATSLEMAGAYATIANGGEYIEPTFYTKVEDASGKVILEAEQERRRVLSDKNAYILQTILKEPVYGANGTGGGARISGQEVRGKTGSTDDYSDRWFCGFTPYYSAATWFGYDKIETTSMTRGTNRALSIWVAVMKDIHSGLEAKNYEKPSGIVNGGVCRDSGLLATELCKQDPRGSRAYSEIFAAGTVPTKACTTHVKIKICKETGKIANEFCKDVEEKVFITRENSDRDMSWKNTADAQYMAPIDTCDVHTLAPDTEKPVITLNLDNKTSITLKPNDKYDAKDATAKDNIDGDLTDKIKREIKKDGKTVDKVDTSKEGTYNITYTVSDAAGNTATKTRTITIKKETSGNNNTVNNTNTTNTVTNTTKPTTNTTNTTKKH